MTFSRAKAALSGTRFADLRWVAETGSTNTDAHRMLVDADRVSPGATLDVVLVADHQRAGRGRLGRTWEAPSASSLLMSVGTTAEVGESLRGLLLTAMSLAACEAIEDVCGVRPLLKWPNDLVVTAADGRGVRKIAGVLAESVPLTGARTGYVVGIGINCNWGSVEGELASVAASLDVLAGSSIDREDLAGAIVGRFAERLEVLETADGTAAPGVVEMVDDARALSATVGLDAVVTLPAASTGALTTLRGRAVDLDADGALLVDTGGATPERVVVGDVVSLRSGPAAQA